MSARTQHPYPLPRSALSGALLDCASVSLGRTGEPGLLTGSDQHSVGWLLADSLGIGRHACGCSQWRGPQWCRTGCPGIGRVHPNFRRRRPVTAGRGRAGRVASAGEPGRATTLVAASRPAVRSSPSGAGRHRGLRAAERSSTRLGKLTADRSASDTAADVLSNLSDSPAFSVPARAAALAWCLTPPLGLHRYHGRARQPRRKSSCKRAPLNGAPPSGSLAVAG